MARPSLAQAVYDAHQRGRIILMDGPMATELRHSGLDLERDLSHRWNLNHPESVKVVYEDYSNAGAEVLLTNTFSAHLGLLKGEEDWHDAVAAGVELAKQPEWDHLYVLGSVGSAVGSDEQYAGAVEQVIESLSECDGILLETQTRLDRARAICSQLSAISRTGNLREVRSSAEASTLIVSFSYNRLPRQDRCWIVEAPNEEERSALEVAKWAHGQRDQLLALGVNCGNNLRLSDTLRIAQQYHAETDLPLLVRPGITPSIECEFTPREFAEKVKNFADAGVTLLGGCCGTTPAHIAALRKEIDRLGLAWQDE